MTRYDVIVIGEGPAGLMAAGQAAQSGAKTLLLAKMDKLGRKLLLTGNGRCNLTNRAPLEEFIKHFRPDGRFLRQAFNYFFSDELMDFFEELGVTTCVEQGEYVFPESGKAQDVLDALVRWVQGNGVEIKTQSAVKKIIIDDGRAIGVETIIGQSFFADALILATGGASYPSTGSSGDGYRMAEEAGHKIIPIRPALVPVETTGDTAQQLQGLGTGFVGISLFADGKRIGKSFWGELMFTHFGISGPGILKISGDIADLLGEGKKVEVSIDLVPEVNEKVFEKELITDFKIRGKQQINTLLKRIIQERLVEVCLNQSGIAAETLCSQITVEQRKKLVSQMKDFRFEVSGVRPLKEAMVTAGGVDTREIDPRTMESRIVKGLYFAGEVIDIDGDTGGYNLQAAFSMGYLAGWAAADKSS